MPAAIRVTDPNNGGGVVITTSATKVFINNLPAATIMGTVTPHSPCPKVSSHCGATTNVGAMSVFYHNIKASVQGNPDTCGHSRQTGSSNVFIGNYMGGGGAGEGGGGDYYLENPETPLDGNKVDDGFISNENPDENMRRGNLTQENECPQEQLSRLGNPSGSAKGETPLVNKIENTQIVVNCNKTIDTQMRLTPTSNAEDVTWSWTAIPGCNLNNATGKITGLIEDNGQYDVVVTAYSAGNKIDSKSYKVIADDCNEEDSIKFIHPLPGSVCTSTCSVARNHPVENIVKPHRGCDFAYIGNLTKTVFASADGIVLKSYNSVSYGNAVVLGHRNSKGKFMCCTMYAHLARRDVQVGQFLTAGQPLGFEGGTGANVTGPHLHFEIRGADYIQNDGASINQSAEVYDPLEYIGGELAIDDTVAGKAKSTQKPSDPGNPGGITRTKDNGGDGNRAITPAVVDNKCRVYASPQQTTDRGGDATGFLAGNSTNGYRSDCAPAQKANRAETIIKIKETLNEYPDLDQDDKDFILVTARIEADYDPYAKNPTTSATGLYQMIDSTAIRCHSNVPPMIQYSAANPVPCSLRCNVEESTRAMVYFYKTLLNYYDSYISSGKQTIIGKPIVVNNHTRRYPMLSKRTFIYMLHHDGVGNVIAGQDKGGVDYVLTKFI